MHGEDLIELYKTKQKGKLQKAPNTIYRKD